MKSAKAGTVKKLDDVDADEPQGTDRRFITALARGLEVLRAFEANDPPLSNQELARRTGLPRPTISRITFTLGELGYLTYDEEYGRYALGGAAFALGHVAASNFNLLRSTRPAMERMAELSGANVGLATREGTDMLYVDACLGQSIIVLRFEAGARVPLAYTAMGAAYFAAASSDERASINKLIRRKYKQDETEISLRFERASYELSTHGFCTSFGEWHEAINGLAVPIRSPELGGLFVLNCGAPAFLLPKSKVMEMGPLLVETAEKIKETLRPGARSGRFERVPRRND